MDLRGFCEFIVDVEQSLEIETLDYRGLNLWPIARFELFREAWRRQQGAAVAVTEEATLESPVTNNQILRVGAHDGSVEQAHLQGVDFLFLSRAEDHKDQFSLAAGAGNYDRYVDPLVELARGQGFSAIKVEPVADISAETQPRLVETRYFERFNSPWPRQIGLRTAAAVLDEIEAAVNTRAYDVSLNRPGILHRADCVLDLQLCFRQVLRRYRPGCVFVVCYYSTYAAAMIKACRDLGIPSIEIQHGQGGPYSPYKSHWPRIPVGGFDLLPDKFWTWGKQSSDFIEHRMSDSPRAPTTVIGGNLWLSGWQRGRYPASPLAAEFLHSIAAFERRVLVSLQPLPEPLPAHAIEAMRDAPDHWIWLIRLHPHARTRAPEIAQLLASNNVRHFEIEKSTNCALCELLPRVDHHVTCWSSVCFEASAFAIPTTIVHETGRELFAGRIAAGSFAYAPDAQALLREIAAPSSSPVADYIETDARVAIEALRAQHAAARAAGLAGASGALHSLFLHQMTDSPASTQAGSSAAAPWTGYFHDNGHTIVENVAQSRILLDPSARVESPHYGNIIEQARALASGDWFCLTNNEYLDPAQIVHIIDLCAARFEEALVLACWAPPGKIAHFARFLIASPVQCRLPGAAQGAVEALLQKVIRGALLERIPIVDLGGASGLLAVDGSAHANWTTEWRNLSRYRRDTGRFHFTLDCASWRVAGQRLVRARRWLGLGVRREMAKADVRLEEAAASR